MKESIPRTQKGLGKSAKRGAVWVVLGVGLFGGWGGGVGGAEEKSFGFFVIWIVFGGVVGVVGVGVWGWEWGVGWFVFVWVVGGVGFGFGVLGCGGGVGGLGCGCWGVV